MMYRARYVDPSTLKVMISEVYLTEREVFAAARYAQTLTDNKTPVSIQEALHPTPQGELPQWFPYGYFPDKIRYPRPQPDPHPAPAPAPAPDAG